MMDFLCPAPYRKGERPFATTLEVGCMRGVTK